MSILKKHALLDRTHLLGFQPHVRLLEEAYKHHIFLSPSVTASDGDSEGGAPVTIIEMAATGMPVVSTTHCDIPQVIPHGTAGLLADERDVAGLVKHLEWLVQNPEQWEGLVSQARAHIEKNFDAVIQGQQLAEFYASLLK